MKTLIPRKLGNSCYSITRTEKNTTKKKKKSKYHLFQKSAGKKIPCMHCLKHKMQPLIQLLKLMQNIQSTNIYIKTE